MPKVSKNSKKNLRNLRRKMIGGGLDLESIQSYVSSNMPALQELVTNRYSQLKGTDYIWSMIKKYNSRTGKKYCLYYDEVKVPFNDLGCAIIWDSDIFGDFLTGNMTTFDDVGRGLLFMVTEKQGNHYLFISSQNANAGSKAINGYPDEKIILEGKTTKFLQAVNTKTRLNLQNVIFTGDLNDKFGKMLANGIKFTDGTIEFKLEHDLDVLNSLNDPTSCCPNWDSSGEPLYFTKESEDKITYPAPSFNPVYPTDLDFSVETKEMLQEKYGYQLEASEVDSQGKPSNNKTIPGLLAKFKKGNQVSGEAFKGDLLTGLERPCAGSGFRFELPDNKQQNYIFHGDYAYILNPNDNKFDNSVNGKMLVTPFLEYPEARVEDRSVASDHELVSSTNNGFTIGSYNMSYASDLGNIPNKVLVKGIPNSPANRQESEAAFLLPLHKDMKKDQGNLGSRSYFNNAVANLMHFIETQSPAAIGLQEVNNWKSYSYFNQEPITVFKIGDAVNAYMPELELKEEIKCGPQQHEFDSPAPLKRISELKGAGTFNQFTSELEWLIFADPEFRNDPLIKPLLTHLDNPIKNGSMTDDSMKSTYDLIPDKSSDFNQLREILNIELTHVNGVTSAPAAPSPAEPVCVSPVSIEDIYKFMFKLNYPDQKVKDIDLPKLSVCVGSPPENKITGLASAAAGGKKSHRRSSVAHKKSTESHKSAVAKLFQASTKNGSKIPAKKSLKMVKVRSRR